MIQNSEHKKIACNMNEKHFPFFVKAEDTQDMYKDQRENGDRRLKCLVCQLLESNYWQWIQTCSAQSSVH